VVIRQVPGHCPRGDAAGAAGTDDNVVP